MAWRPSPTVLRVLPVDPRLRTERTRSSLLNALDLRQVDGCFVTQSTCRSIVSTRQASPFERREAVMTTCGRRIRAAIGMGLVWGVAWFGAGTLLARVPGFYSDLPFALLFAPLGLATGIIFSGILVGIEGGRGFDRMSLWRFAGWGAVSGLLLSGIFVVGAALRGAALWEEFLVFGPPLAIASAVCAAGSLAVARRGERRELPGGSGHPAEAELTEDEKRELLGRGD